MSAYFLRRRLREQGDDGLTLIEVVVAMTLTVMVLSAFLATTVGALAANRAAEHRVRGNQLVNERLEWLKSMPWSSAGLYTSDGAASTYGGENTVLLTGSPAASRPLPVETVSRNNLNYTLTTQVTWRDDPANGVNPSDQDIKHFTVTVSWNDGSATKTVSGQALRSPTTAERAASTTTSASTLTPSATPATQSLTASGYLTSAITVSVTASSTATSVKFSYATQAGTQVANMTKTTGNTWAYTLSTTSGPYNTGTETFSVTATSPTGTDSGSTSVTLNPPAGSYTLTASVAPTPSQSLTSSGYFTSAVTLTATTSVAVTSVSVSYATKSGTTTTPMTGSGTSWSLTLGTGSGPYNSGTETFTFTATGSSTVTTTKSITLSGPLAAISFGTLTPSPNYAAGNLCVKKNANSLFGPVAITVAVSNVASTDTVKMSWTNPSGSPVTLAYQSTSGSTLTFSGSIPDATTFNGASTLTVSATRAADGATASQTYNLTWQAQPNSGKC